MRVSDFERAIEALKYDIEIDEIKLRGGHVHQVIGHDAGLNVIWDELGRAFTMSVGQELERFVDLDSRQIVNGRRLQRDPEIDLKFE